MSLGGEIMEEFYEVNIIPKYKNLLRKCLSTFYAIDESEGPKNTLHQSEIIKELELFLNDCKG